jgi:DUF4097 and DUF4098 domain-containing protein YvlB
MFSCSLLSKKYEKKEKEEYKISAVNKTAIRLNNVSGKVTISKGDSTTGIVVKAEKIGYVRKKDLDKPLENMQVIIDTSSGVVQIKSEFEKDREWFHWDFHGKEINYNIIVPANIKVNVDNVNGEIELEGVNSEVEASTVNGTIKFDNLSGIKDLSTVNGKISGRIDSVKNIKLGTVNGAIDLDISKSFMGSIKATVVNGRIRYENLTLSDVNDDKKSLRGFIGNKDNELSIDAVNGRITLTGK